MDGKRDDGRRERGEGKEKNKLKAGKGWGRGWGSISIFNYARSASYIVHVCVQAKTCMLQILQIC